MRRARVSFPRFTDLDERLVNCDMHVHTNQTDGVAGVPEILSEASRRGLRAIAITEHVRRETDWYPSFARHVRSAREGAGLTVHVGIEAKALDTKGTLDAPDAVVADAEMVLGSVHRFPATGSGFLRIADLQYEDAARLEFELALGLTHGSIDVLAHPGGMCLRHFRAFPPEYLRFLMHVCAEEGIAIEINSSYLLEFDAYLDLCREMDPPVSVGSDAHRLDELGRCRDALRERGIGRP